MRDLEINVSISHKHYEGEELYIQVYDLILVSSSGIWLYSFWIIWCGILVTSNLSPQGHSRPNCVSKLHRPYLALCAVHTQPMT